MSLNSELHCHYPEKIYLSSVLPTRTPRELRGFQHHCQEQYRTGAGQEFVYEFSLRDLREITTSALNFQNLLYRNQVILTASGIIEYYTRIRRNTRVNSTDTAYLEPAYEVSYTWNQNSWVVTQIESARERARKETFHPKHTHANQTIKRTKTAPTGLTS